MRRLAAPLPVFPPLLLELARGPVRCEVVRGKGRRVLLRINREQRLELRVPRGGSVVAAYAWARTRAAWAEAALARAAARPQPLAFNDGATHQLRGQSVRLALHGGPPEVWLSRNVLHVQLAQPNSPAQVQHTLAAHYRSLALAELPPRVAELARALPWRCAAPRLRLRLMRARWGCCRHDGLITLSTLLLRASPICSDYVAVHELCHLREFDHGAGFYRLLDKALPDWQAARRSLEALPVWPVAPATASLTLAA